MFIGDEALLSALRWQSHLYLIISPGELYEQGYPQRMRL